MADDGRLKADLDGITAMGKRLKLEGDELRKYVRSHMKGLGYGTETTYVPPKKETGGKSGGILGGLFSDDEEDDES